MKRALLPLILLAACAAPEAAKPPEPVAQVRTGVASTGDAAAQLTLYGAAEAAPGATHALIAASEATLAAIAAPAGTAVAAGTVVATLRPSATAQVDTAKAATDARATAAAAARAARLRADGLVGDTEVETARTAARDAAALSASLAARAAGLTLRAPVAGTVAGLTAKPGDLIPAGTTVATIIARGDLRARFGIDPGAAARVRAGQPIRLGTLGGASATAAITGVDPTIDPATRLASVTAPLPASVRAGPGEALRGLVSASAATAVVTIPYAALLDDGGTPFVFVVTGGVAHRRPVTLADGAIGGGSGGERIAVARGVAAGERVVIEGGTGLDDGIKVAERLR